MNHRQTHPAYVEGCFACKAMTFSLAAAATPNRRPTVVHADAKDTALSKDLVAYRNLRRNGLQPRQIDGSADLERSDITSQFDVDLGRVIPKGEQSRVQEAMAISKDLGLITEAGR